MTKLKYIIILSLTVLAATSCSKELFWNIGFHNGKIVPVVKSASTKASGEDSPYGRIVSSRVVAVSDSLELIETVYENDSAPSFCDTTTKGTVITETNLATFLMQAFAEGSWYDNAIPTGPGSKNQPNAAGEYFSVSVSGDNTSGWVMTPEQTWLNDVPISFWCSKDASLTRSTSTTATFTYTVPSSVSAQKDPVVAFNKETRSFYEDGEADYGEIKDAESTGGSSDESINIRFFHALSAIQFFKGDITGTYRIKSIALEGVDSKTTCTVTADPSITPSEGNPNVTFSHVNNTASSFTQEYASGDTSLERSGSYYKTDDAKTFFMIPQNLGSGSSLKVTFINGKDEETSSSFSLDGGSWLPGKYYVYKVGLAGGIKVLIEETCTTASKSNVKFKNTSNVNEYLRAAVVANWCDDNGDVVAAWNKTRDGSFTPGSADWVESGGFYYYTKQIAAGQETPALIPSFTKPVSAPVTGAHFEMTIFVQAVASDGVTSYLAAF